MERLTDAIPLERTRSGRDRAPSSTSDRGLGINVPPPSVEPAGQYNVPRTPVVSRPGAHEYQAGLYSSPLLSPPSTGGFADNGYHSDTTLNDFSSPNINTAYNPTRGLASSQASQTSHMHKGSMASIREEHVKFLDNHVCDGSRHFKKGMNNWLAIGIVLLSVFSTVFSGIFVGIAMRAPRYGRMIGTDGSLSISNAAFLTSLFGKMIELSFVTVVVAFIGQCLARRAFRSEGRKGVTLADMNMRHWVAQPGTLFTHWESVRYAGFSLLGVLAVVSTVMATLYTSAATAVVQPQLKFSHWERRTLQGTVATSFANTQYLQQTCKTPITQASLLDDDEDRMNTCIQIEHASQAYHNYQHWLSHWTDVVGAGNGSVDLASRPPGWALLNDNTTITGPWIERKNFTLHEPQGWAVNNITMAFPHPGVVQAAQDPVNGIMQPNELNGLGIYSIRAAVPSPFINVICVTGINGSSLHPLVYRMWRNSTEVNDATWPDQLSNQSQYVLDPFLGGTDFDDIFEWGEQYGSSNWPPVFPRLPDDYNTVANDTTGAAYGRKSIYVLGKGVPTASDNYAICQMQVGLTPQCSTQYNASSNVATLEAVCDEHGDKMQFIDSEVGLPLDKKGLSPYYSQDWPNVASMWIRSINLNSGTIQANSSNARLWTELIFTNPPPIDWTTSTPTNTIYTLNMDLPSPAEALAVLSGCTLLQSAQDAPFVEFWNYSGYGLILDSPQTQVFNASVHQQQYASGGTAGYERAFHVVLFVVFLINLIILIYWFWHRAWYVDFSDPTNLFPLAINSPPSHNLVGCSCGDSGKGGGGLYRQKWTLGNYGDGGHVVMASPDPQEVDNAARSPRSPWKFKRPRVSETFVPEPSGRWTRVPS